MTDISSWARSLVCSIESTNWGDLNEAEAATKKIERQVESIRAETCCDTLARVSSALEATIDELQKGVDMSNPELDVPNKTAKPSMWDALLEKAESVFMLASSIQETAFKLHEKIKEPKPPQGEPEKKSDRPDGFEGSLIGILVAITCRLKQTQDDLDALR